MTRWTERKGNEQAEGGGKKNSRCGMVPTMGVGDGTQKKLERARKSVKEKRRGEHHRKS